jgi:hypothetical protein
LRGRPFLQRNARRKRVLEELANVLGDPRCASVQNISRAVTRAGTRQAHPRHSRRDTGP